MKNKDVYGMICEANLCDCDECDVRNVCHSASRHHSVAEYTDDDFDLFFHRLKAFRDELSFFLSKLDS